MSFGKPSALCSIYSDLLNSSIRACYSVLSTSRSYYLLQNYTQKSISIVYFVYLLSSVPLVRYLFYVSYDSYGAMIH